MHISTHTIDCRVNYPRSARENPFRYVVYCFDYQYHEADRLVIDHWFQKATELAQRVNTKAANDATRQRNAEKVVENCLAGVISEACWRHYLNDRKTVGRVVETPYVDGRNQIDMLIRNTRQTIEVRSSFPRNSIDFSLCHPTYEFDVLGPYANGYKPGEVLKDYYVRALFHLPVNPQTNRPQLLTRQAKQPDFEVYLTGGATWMMMMDEQISKRKALVPPDELDMLSEKTDYRVVPFSQALDTVEVYEMIKALHENTL